MKSLNLLLSCFLLLSFNVSAEKAPVEMEVGVGIFTLQTPHYLGSDQSETYILPMPYFYYLDENIKVDRNQFTGKLFTQGNVYFDLSASAGIKVNSEDNNARHGMEDVDWVFELGPSLKYYFDGDPQQSDFLYTELFTRKATATDFHSLTNVGWRYGISSTYQNTFVLPELGQGEFELAARINVNFSDDRYLNYYYGVPESATTHTRESYFSKSGYAGTDLSAGIIYKVNQWWFAGFTRYYNYNGVEYDESPLLKTNHNWSVGIGFSWIFYQSKDN